MRRLLPLAALLLALPASAAVSVKRSPERPRTLDVDIVREPLSVAVAALEMYLPAGVDLSLDYDPLVSLRARATGPEQVLRQIAHAAGVALTRGQDRYVMKAAGEQSVTLDVKDAEARVILKSLQRQCGVKNLIIDPGVQGTGTFLFRDVPCRSAFRIVLRSLGLSTVSYAPSVATVEARKY